MRENCPKNGKSTYIADEYYQINPIMFNFTVKRKQDYKNGESNINGSFPSIMPFCALQVDSSHNILASYMGFYWNMASALFMGDS